MLAPAVSAEIDLSGVNFTLSFETISGILVRAAADSISKKSTQSEINFSPNISIPEAVIRYEPEDLANLGREYLQKLTAKLLAACPRLEQASPSDNSQGPVVESLFEYRTDNRAVFISALMTLLNADGLASRASHPPVSFPQPSAEGLNKIASFFTEPWETSTKIPEEAVLQTRIPTDGNHIFVIPDLHGESALLEGALGVIKAQIQRQKQAQGLEPNKVTIVCLGDYLNKGPDSEGVVSRLIEARANSGQENELSGVTFKFLRGNHEEVEGIGFHLRGLAADCSDEEVEEYAKRFAEAVEKGFGNTVRSYAKREGLAEEDKDALVSFVEGYPVRDGERGWIGSNIGQQINEQEALSFFKEFSTLWQKILTESGHAEFFNRLNVAAQSGEWVFVHGGLPSETEQLEELCQQLKSGADVASEKTISAVCNANRLNSFSLSQSTLTELLLQINRHALVVGHSPGAGFKGYTISDGGQRLIFGADSGAWRTGALFVPYIKPNGNLSILAVTQHGTFPFHPSLLPPPGRKPLSAKG